MGGWGSWEGAEGSGSLGQWSAHPKVLFRKILPPSPPHVSSSLWLANRDGDRGLMDQLTGEQVDAAELSFFVIIWKSHQVTVNLQTAIWHLGPTGDGPFGGFVSGYFCVTGRK